MRSSDEQCQPGGGLEMQNLQTYLLSAEPEPTFDLILQWFLCK